MLRCASLLIVLIALAASCATSIRAEEIAATADLPPALLDIGPEGERMLSQLEAGRVRGGWTVNLPVDNILLQATGTGSFDISISTPRISVQLIIGN